MPNNTFAVLVTRDDGQLGLLTTSHSRDFDRGNFEVAVEKARVDITKKRDNWQQTFYMMSKLTLAEINFGSNGSWDVVKFI